MYSLLCLTSKALEATALELNLRIIGNHSIVFFECSLGLPYSRAGAMTIIL